MKTADLYVRVSTDEQADRGYSVRSQEEVLRKYCGIQNIMVRKVVYEDYSAKTFNRPAWTEMLAELRKEKDGKPSLLLFTKWDRFSRNAGDAYQMINVLRKLGIDPQAVEQPLDLSIPENKMMLAFYLAAPEVENDRRALNTFHGMRRAKKEGRYLTTGPFGYVNRTTETGRKTIVPIEPKAGLVRWAFEEVAKQRYAVDQIRKELNRKGLNCSKSNFYNLLKNPVYCGKIVVPQYKDEPRALVDGQHEAIITERLFCKVQDVLEGNKRPVQIKITSPEDLPLRNYLICPKCGRQLTGSASKGRKGNYFHYYHCIPDCHTRFNAVNANEIFEKELGKFLPKQGMAELYAMIVKDVYNRESGSQFDERRDLLNRIHAENDRLSKGLNFLLDGTIASTEYKALKAGAEKKLLNLEARLSCTTKATIDIDGIAENALSSLFRLDLLYNKLNVTQKRYLIGSIFPEKLCFDGSAYRTAKIGKAVNLIYVINSRIQV
jgi:DNA invertase Pin-like site-specific DNA recombinase